MSSLQPRLLSTAADADVADDVVALEGMQTRPGSPSDLVRALLWLGLL